MKLVPDNIYHGDCLDLMAGIDDHSIDMILADLPYGTTACAWDSIIPLEPLWAHYKRVIKRNGAIVLTGSQPFTSVLINSNLDWFKYEWVWDKKISANYLASNKLPLFVHENIIYFSPGTVNNGGKNPAIYNPQMIKRLNPRMGELNSNPYSQKNPKYHYLRDRNKSKVVWNSRYPISIIEITNANRSIKFHPTQKPIALFAYLIRTYTNPGDLVLDNVIGSGTTAIAAIDTGRQWIGIEKDEGYYKLAKERIEKRLQQPFLIEPGQVEMPEQATFLE